VLECAFDAGDCGAELMAESAELLDIVLREDMDPVVVF
jgi:hypothetical protein